MAVVDGRREGCDGCGRLVLPDRLTTVTMPDGETVACCPDCEPYARDALERLASLDQRRATCDGCTGEFPRDDLEDAVLADGTVVTCCPDCLAEVPGRGDGGTDASVGDDGGPGAYTESTDLATTRNRCGQCQEWFDAELYRVTTVDDRTEVLCAGCKERLEADGVVVDVAMRRAEAREILGVGEDATDAEIREAFLAQVKRAHPDRKSGSRSAFRLVKEAYDRLR